MQGPSITTRSPEARDLVEHIEEWADLSARAFQDAHVGARKYRHAGP